MKKIQMGLLCSLLILGCILQPVSARNSHEEIDPSCQLPGKEDSYKLAMSWQPAFCENHKGKPECKITDKGVYQASYFTLHGLWPNKHECGANYGLCGQYKEKVNSFCDYEALPMQAGTLKELAEIMPSVAAGSCLDRHEWYKHGTCQTDWNADQYFHTAIRLVKEFNKKEIAEFMHENTGKSVRVLDFLKVVDQALGKNASKRLNLNCDKERRLVDVFVNLPKQIPANASLADLIQQAPENFTNRCGQRFTIDAIGFEEVEAN